MEMDPKRLGNVPGPCEELGDAGSISPGEAPLDQIFQDLLSSMQRMKEVLQGAKAVLVHGERNGEWAVAVKQFEDHSAEIENHSAHIVQRLKPSAG